MEDQDKKKTFWEKAKPKLIDAGIIAGGVGAGMGLGVLSQEYLRNNTRIGRHWDRFPPETRMKILIPATAGLAAGTFALSAIRDSYRHQESPKREPVHVIVDKNLETEKTAALEDVGRYLARMCFLTHE